MSLESSPAAGFFLGCDRVPPKADDDRIEPPMGPPTRRRVRRGTPRSSSLFEALRIDHQVLRSVFSFFWDGNRERLAGVQGAAMSPLVAGTMPAKFGMEALGPSPSSRPSSAVPLSRRRAGERVPSTDADGQIIKCKPHAVLPCRSGRTSPHDLGDNHLASRLFAIHLPVSGEIARAPAAGGFAVSPATRAGTTFYPCRPDPGSCTTYCVRRPTTRSQDREGEPI
jgi:hypothetical protein